MAVLVDCNQVFELGEGGHGDSFSGLIENIDIILNLIGLPVLLDFG
jgi:hypothetical protein